MPAVAGALNHSPHPLVCPSELAKIRPEAGTTELLADHVPDLVSVIGPVVTCGGPRGTIRPSNGGYAVLGQLIADVTGAPYREAVTDLVLAPLGM